MDEGGRGKNERDVFILNCPQEERATKCANASLRSLTFLIIRSFTELNYLRSGENALLARIDFWNQVIRHIGDRKQKRASKFGSTVGKQRLKQEDLRSKFPLCVLEPTKQKRYAKGYQGQSLHILDFPCHGTHLYPLKSYILFEGQEIIRMREIFFWI